MYLRGSQVSLNSILAHSTTSPDSSNSVEPTDDEEKDLFNLANRVPFDERVNHKAEMSDLNITLIQNYLKEYTAMHPEAVDELVL